MWHMMNTYIYYLVHASMDMDRLPVMDVLVLYFGEYVGGSHEYVA